MTVAQLIEKLTITTYLPVFMYCLCEGIQHGLYYELWQKCTDNSIDEGCGEGWVLVGEGKTKFLAILDYLKRGLR